MYILCHIAGITIFLVKNKLIIFYICKGTYDNYNKFISNGKITGGTASQIGKLVINSEKDL